jgi:nucleoside-diphosphate-sugar epimerase
MRVFITGINGLIGRHTAKALEKSGNSVFGISQRESIKPNIIQCDFFDSQKLFSILEKVNPDIIIHLAWYTDPKTFYESEANKAWSEQTKELIKVFFKKPRKKFIFASSCAEYDLGRGFSGALTENDITSPNTLYGIEKLKVTNFLSNYKAAKNKWISLRVFFVTGVGESCLKLLSNSTIKLLKNKKVNLKTPNSFLDFIDAREVAIIIELLSKNSFSGVINVGRGEYIRVAEIINLINDRLGIARTNFGQSKRRFSTIYQLVADTTLLKKVLPEHQSFPIELTIDDIVQYYSKTK